MRAASESNKAKVGMLEEEATKWEVAAEELRERLEAALKENDEVTKAKQLLMNLTKQACPNVLCLHLEYRPKNCNIGLHVRCRHKSKY